MATMSDWEEAIAAEVSMYESWADMIDQLTEVAGDGQS